MPIRLRYVKTSTIRTIILFRSHSPPSPCRTARRLELRCNMRFPKQVVLSGIGSGAGHRVSSPLPWCRSSYAENRIFGMGSDTYTGELPRFLGVVAVTV